MFGLIPWLRIAAPALFNPWLLLAFAVYTASIAGFAAFQGYQSGVSKYYEYVAAQAAETVRFIVKVQEVVNTVRVPYAVRETVIEKVYITLESEAKHVPSRDACNVTAGWMRFHDRAAEGQAGRVEGALDDATDTGIKEAVAAATVAENYKAFHQTANDLKACRAFATGLQGLTE